MKFCDKCDQGFIYYLDDNKEEAVKKCECLIESQNKKFKELVFKKSGLPKFIKKYTLDNYLGDKNSKTLLFVKEFLKNFNEYKNISLYFHSNQRGNQKTTVAQYIVKELLYRRYDCRFILMGDFITILENEKFKEEDKQLRDELLMCDLLVIDDCFDKNKNNMYKSGYQLSFLDKFIRNRLEVINKSIIFTSNYSIQDIDPKIFGYDIPSLLKRNISIYKYELEFSDNVENYQIKNSNFSIDNLKNKLFNAINSNSKKVREIKVSDDSSSNK